MKYSSVVFENQNIKNYISENEHLISEAAIYVAKMKPFLIDYVFENLQNFIVIGDLATTHSNIKSFIITENLLLYEFVSDILSDTNISYDSKLNFLQEVSIWQSIKHSLNTNASSLKPAIDNIKNIFSSKGVVQNVDGAYSKLADFVKNLTSKNKKLVNTGVVLTLASLYGIPVAGDVLPAAATVGSNAVPIAAGVGLAGVGTAAYYQNQRLKNLDTLDLK